MTDMLNASTPVPASSSPPAAVPASVPSTAAAVAPVSPVMPAPTPAPAAPAPAPAATVAPAAGTPAAAGQPLALDPGQPVTLRDPATGQTVQMTGADVMRAHQDVQRMRAAGFDLYERALSGDEAAGRQYLSMLANRHVQAPTYAPQAPQPPAPQDPNAVSSQELQEMREFVRSARGQQVETSVRSLLAKPDFAALAQRPAAVQEVVTELLKLHQSGVQLNPTVVNNTLATLNGREQEYQQRILAPYRDRLGELGVPDPFRGGDPQAANLQRPNPVGQHHEYKNYLGQRWRGVVSQLAAEQKALAG